MTRLTYWFFWKSVLYKIKYHGADFADPERACCLGLHNAVDDLQQVESNLFGTLFNYCLLVQHPES